MTRYLLDTNHAGQLVKGDADLWNRLRPHPDDEFSACRPSICELWYMVLNSGRVGENQARLESFIRKVRVWELDADACFEYGRIKVELRKQGTPIPQIDAQIAAIARTQNLTVLSADRHFRWVAGLRVENWL